MLPQHFCFEPSPSAHIPHLGNEPPTSWLPIGRHQQPQIYDVASFLTTQHCCLAPHGHSGGAWIWRTICVLGCCPLFLHFWLRVTSMCPFFCWCWCGRSSREVRLRFTITSFSGDGNRRSWSGYVVPQVCGLGLGLWVFWLSLVRPL